MKILISVLAFIAPRYTIRNTCEIYHHFTYIIFPVIVWYIFLCKLEYYFHLVKMRLVCTAYCGDFDLQSQRQRRA
jgi:hypothetical protein